MALKLIGAVGIKVRPDAEHFRDEAERDIKKQLKDGVNVPVKVHSGLDEKKLKKDLDAHKKKLRDNLERTSKPIQFTTDIKFDTAGWKKAKDFLKKSEADIRNEMEATRSKLTDLDKQRKSSLRLARELALEHKKLAERAFRGTASGNDVAKIKGQYDLVRQSLRQTTSQIDRLKLKLQASNDDMVEWGRNSGQYADNLRKAVVSHEDLIRKTAIAHSDYMAKVRKDSENLLGGLSYGIRKNVEAISRALKSTNDRLPSALQIDVEDFKSRLHHIKSLFKRTTDEMDDTEVDIKPVLDESAQRIAWARLKLLTRDRWATIHVRVNKASATAAQQLITAIYGASGARKGVDFLKDTGRYLRDLDKHVPALGMIGTLAASATGGVLALAGSISHLIVQLVQMSGAALALPGILGGFAVGIGAMVAVLRDFNQEVPQIKQDLGDLQNSMSSNFWKQAKIPIMDAWNKMFPHFSKGIQETSTQLGKWTSAMAKAFSTHFDMSAFDKMFVGLNASIGIAALSANDVASAVSILGQKGAEYLPRMALWANDVARGFNNWLVEAEKTGKLNEIIDTGIDRIKEFGKLVRETGEFIYILGSAAERAGFSGLKEMADGMERFNEALKNPEGRQSLDDLMAGAAAIADGFKRAISAVTEFAGAASGALREVAETVGDMIGDTFEGFFKALEQPEFLDGLTNFFDGISKGLENLTDSAPSIARVAGAIGTLAGAVAENLGEVIGTLFEALDKPISGNVDSVASSIKALGKGLTDAIKAAGEYGILTAAVEALGVAAGVAGGALQVLAFGMDLAFGGGDKGKKSLDFMQNIIDQDIPWVSWAMKQNQNLTLAIATVVASVKSAFTGLQQGLQGNIQGLLFYLASNPIGEMIAEKLFGLKAPAGVSWPDFVSQILTDMGFNGDFANDFGIVFDRIKEGITTAWNDFWSWVGDLFGGNDTGWTGTATTDLGSIVSDMFDIDALISSLQGKANEIIATVQNWWAEVLAKINNLFEAAGRGGQIVLDFVLNAIDNASGIIATAIAFGQNFAANVWQAILTAIDHASNVIQWAKNRAEEFARGFYQAVMRARDAASGLIETVKNKATSFAAGVYQAVMRAKDSASNIIRRVRAAADSFGAMVRQATLRAKDSASEIIRRVIGFLGSIPGSITTVVKAVFQKINPFSAGGLIQQAKGAKFADGGFFGVPKGGFQNPLRNPAIRTIEHHVAQIAPAGAMRLWAERETGGEAYIPLSPAKRTRSEQILSTVADKFGMRLERYANGSEPTANRQVVSQGGDNYTVNIEAVPTDQAEEVSSTVMFELKHLKRGGSPAFA